MDVRPGAEPYRHDADGPAVLLCHGFTGSPASLRPWAEHHARAGAAVSLPLLPGHGTHWRDMQRTRWPDWYDAVRTELLELTDARGPAVIGALSMGASLALRLAAERPDLVRGLVLVNPSIKQDGILPSFAPLLQYVVPSVKGISNDAQADGVDEVAYSRVPLRAFSSLRRLWREAQANLGKVRAPLLVFRSREDHVVDGSNTDLLLSRVASTHIEEHVLEHSFHVATLDNDAPAIFDGSWQFVEELTKEPAP